MNNTGISLHYTTERQDRDSLIQQNFGDGNVVDTFLVDKDGVKEIHEVTDSGLIIVKNPLTSKVVTKLIARPKQLRRLYESQDRTPPPKLMKLAYKHNALGYNQW